MKSAENTLNGKDLVEILLSTYNSAVYLDDLFESLKKQTYTNWRLLIRDDGSTDNTLNQLLEYQKANPDKYRIIKNDKINLGSKRSFEKLLENSTADYIMFCDHDDFWLAHKIEETLRKIKEIENEAPSKAAMVFTDLTIVDQKLNIIHKSFWKYSKINPDNIRNVYKLCINNPVVGCTVMINKAAKILALPIPNQANMHDKWIALKVAESGVVGFIEKPGILYRLHNENEIGTEKANINYFLKRLRRINNTLKQNKESILMLKALGKKYSTLKMIAFKFIILWLKIIQ